MTPAVMKTLRPAAAQDMPSPHLKPSTCFLPLTKFIYHPSLYFPTPTPPLSSSTRRSSTLPLSTAHLQLTPPFFPDTPHTLTYPLQSLFDIPNRLSLSQWLPSFFLLFQLFFWFFSSLSFLRVPFCPFFYIFAIIFYVLLVFTSFLNECNFYL